MAKLSVSCVYANFSHLYVGIFCLRIFYLFKCPFKLSKSVYSCFLITPWKCEYCLIWALNNQYCLVEILWKLQYCLIMIWNLEKFVVLFVSRDSSRLENFLEHIFKMVVNSKLDFRWGWKFYWDLRNAISGGNWLFRWDCIFSGGTLYHSPNYV